MKEEIINLIENKEPISVERLSELLKSDEKKTKILLLELIKDHKIYKNENGEYLIISKEDLIERIRSSKNSKYILVNDKKIYIEKENLHSALNNDLVLVSITENNKGIVKSILERKNNKLVCEVIEKNGKKRLVSFDNTFGISLAYSDSFLDKLVCGDRIITKIDDKTDENNTIQINNYTKIGHKDDPLNDEICIAISKDFDIDFSSDTYKEIEKMPDKVSDEEKQNRLDLTHEMIFTIDSETTKDIDDAISLRKLFNGNYLLGVHIADVAHYVKPNSSIYKDAKKRATSLYLGESVIPMLPHELSNGICSLNEGVDRLTKSCIMEITPQGKIEKSKIVYSIINSKKKMTYKEVNQILDLESVPKGYENFANALILMQELSEIITRNKKKRGSLSFASNEIKVELNKEKTEAENFKKRTTGKGEELIENFMVLANESVATKYYWKNLPFVYRIHDNPDEEKLDNTIEIIQNINNKLIKLKEARGIQALKIVLDKLKEDKNFQIYSNMLLRNMAKAKYSSNNIGHFALALDNYCHFTSPIRRFPDLQIHTLIDEYSNNIKDRKNIEKINEELISVCEHSSYKERQSDEAEKDYLRLKMAKYMQNHIGEEFDGTIISIDNTNVVVKLDNNITGLIDIFTGFTNTFEIDNTNKEIRSKHSKQKINLGTKIRIKVSRVNVNQKEILFDLKHIYKDYEKKLELK